MSNRLFLFTLLNVVFSMISSGSLVQRFAAPVTSRATQSIAQAGGIPHEMGSAVNHILLLSAPENIGALRKYVASPDMKEIVKNPYNAVGIYDTVKKEWDSPNMEILTELKKIAFERNIPSEFKTPEEILAFGRARNEYFPYLLKSNAFNTYISDPVRLESLLNDMKHENLIVANKWNIVKPKLEQLLWKSKALEGNQIQNDDKFLQFISDQQRARDLFLALKGKEVDPALLEKIKLKAFPATFRFETTVEYATLKGMIKKYQQWGVLDTFLSSKDFQRFIEDPLRASKLFGRFGDDKKLLNPHDDGYEFFNVLEKAALRNFKNTEDVLKTLEEARDWNASHLKDLPQFQRVIDNDNNFGKIKAKIIENPIRIQHFPLQSGDVGGGNYRKLLNLIESIQNETPLM